MGAISPVEFCEDSDQAVATEYRLRLEVQGDQREDQCREHRVFDPSSIASFWKNEDCDEKPTKARRSNLRRSPRTGLFRETPLSPGPVILGEQPRDFAHGKRLGPKKYNGREDARERQEECNGAVTFGTKKTCGQDRLYHHDPNPGNADDEADRRPARDGTCEIYVCWKEAASEFNAPQFPSL